MSTVQWLPTAAIWNNQAIGTLVMGVPGSGKACWDEEDIITPQGVQKIKNIKIGDKLYGKNGSHTTVTGVYPQGFKTLYKVTVGGDRSLICSYDHLFTVMHYDKDLNKIEETLSVKELLERNYVYYHVQNNNCIEDRKLINIIIVEDALRNFSHEVKNNNLYIDFNNDKMSLKDTVVAFRELGLTKTTIKDNILEIWMPETLATEFGLKNITGKGIKYLQFTSIEEFKVDSCTCFTVDAEDHQYIAGDTVVTHNTFFLLNTAANLLGFGQRIVAIDPKNDLFRIRNIFKEVEVIDVNNIRPGALNPFTFLSNCDSTTLLTIIESICGKLDKNDIIAITPIIKDFITEYKRDGQYRDLQDVADYLYSNPSESAQKIGSMLRLNEDSKYGKLLFTRETNVEPLYIPNNKSLVISLHGMDLPNHTKQIEDYSAEERFTSTIVYLITKKLYEILSTPNRIPTTFICDEAHILFGNREMSNIIHNFLALGRSLNIAVVLASQGIGHFPDNIAQFMSSKFIFKSSMEDADGFLQKFDTSKFDLSKRVDSNFVIGGITELNQGEAYFIDFKGRGGFIKVMSNYDTSLLTSNPLEKKENDN